MTKEEFAQATEQFNYGCDAGSLALVIGDMVYHVQNCTGDGEGTVYVTGKDHIDLPSPFDDELVLSFGNYEKDAKDIIVGFRRFDIVNFMEPRMILRGKHFGISRVRDTNDFVVRVYDLKILRRPKSNVVGSIFTPDEYEDCE